MEASRGERSCIKLTDIDYRPASVGSIALNYDLGPNKNGSPIREGNTVYVPIKQGAKIWSLSGGQQFVLEYPGGTDDKTIYYGGIDKGYSFLVPLISRSWKDNYPAFDWLTRGDEAGFYEQLKPRITRRLEQKYTAKTRRLGFVYATGIPWGWYQSSHDIMYDSEPQLKAMNEQIYGTENYSFEGLVCKSQILGFDDYLIGTGVMRREGPGQGPVLSGLGAGNYCIVALSEQILVAHCAE